MPTSSKPKTKVHNEGPLNPDADPTAPAGMKRQDIRVQLAEKHGISMAVTRDMTLSALVDTLIQSRLDREDEVRRGVATLSVRVQDRTAEALASVEAQADEAVTPPTVDEDDDFSDLDFDDPACKCGTPESEHYSVDPPHMFTPQDEPEYTSPTGQTARIVRQPKRVSLDEAKAALTEAIEARDKQWNLVDQDDAVAAGADYNPDQDMHMPVESMFDDEDDAAFDGEVDAMLSAEKAKPTPIFVGMPDTFDYIFDGHYGASPSGAERWAHCTASLEASRGFLETLSHNQQVAVAKSSTAARQGTTAHAAGEAELLLMLGQITQEEYEHALLDLTLRPEEDEAYDTDMAEHLTEYVDYVRQLHDAGRPLLIEAKVSAKVWLTGAHEGEVSERVGSTDCGAMPHPDPAHPDHHTITAADLKYGNGIDVSVDANPQVRIYLLGLLAKFIAEGGDIDQITTCEYVIVQPRLGGIKVWSESLDDLLTWRDEMLAPALTKALYGQAEGATFAPSEDACQWCVARGGCAALIEDRMAAGASMFDEVMEAEVSGNPVNPALLTNERLGEVLAQIMTVVDLHKDLKEEAQRRLHRGVNVPNFELVNWTPPRSWKEGAETKIKALVDSGAIPSVYKPPALMTPTQASTLLKEQTEALDKVTELIDVHDVKPVVGPDAQRRAARGDHRKSWNGRAPESMFDDESDQHDSPATAIEDMFPEVDA